MLVFLFLLATVIKMGITAVVECGTQITSVVFFPIFFFVLKDGVVRSAGIDGGDVIAVSYGKVEPIDCQVWRSLMVMG